MNRWHDSQDGALFPHALTLIGWLGMPGSMEAEPLPAPQQRASADEQRMKALRRRVMELEAQQAAVNKGSEQPLSVSAQVACWRWPVPVHLHLLTSRPCHQDRGKP